MQWKSTLIGYPLSVVSCNIIQKILTQRSTVDINMISKENLDCEKKEHIEPNC